MPIYEYRCTRCDRIFTESMPIADHGKRRPTCPHCGSKTVEAVLSSFFAQTIRKS